jgi:hypothetical protein
MDGVINSFILQFCAFPKLSFLCSLAFSFVRLKEQKEKPFRWYGFLAPLFHGVICTTCPSSSPSPHCKDYSSALYCSGLVPLGPWMDAVAEQLPSASRGYLIYIDYTRALALLDWQLAPAGFNDTPCCFALLRCRSHARV